MSYHAATPSVYHPTTTSRPGATTFREVCRSARAQHLTTQGYRILARNYRYRKAEIDLIAQKDQLLCFIEVKARTSLRFGYPETFVKSQQRKLIKHAADNYIYTYNWSHPIRFDIISILQKQHTVELTHFEDAFM